MPDREDVITCKNLTFFYPVANKPSIRNVNLHVKRGEFLVITGPSGAGKTTLCLALNGLIPQTATGRLEGVVTTLGMNTKTTPVYEIAKKVGIVFQDPESQFLVGTVKYDVVYALENLLTPREEMLKLLDWSLKITRLEGFEHRLSFRLSGGQKQRVAIAAGLTLRPEILILDEPTAELDPVGKTEVFSTIKKLNEEYGMTIVLVTHDIEQVVDLTDRIVVMNEGQIVTEGEPRATLVEQREKMRELGVKVPQVIELGGLLKQREIIPTIPLNLQEAHTLLSNLVESRRVRSKIARARSDKSERVKENSPIIEVKELSFTYPDPPITALQNVNLKIYSGEMVGIIGQNGSGKTTLVRHFNGLLKPSKGQVIVDGIDTSKATVAELSAKTGYVFQNPDHQIFSNTVRDEVSFGPRNLGFSQKEIEQNVNTALETFELVELVNENPFFLSKGERERVAIAAILAMKPKIVIVDEPTTGQDWKTSMDIMNQCKKLNAMGTTIIAISHDMRLIAENMKKIIVMSQGKILLEGPTPEVFSKPDILKETFLEPPQITQLAVMLNEFGFPRDIVKVEDVFDLFR